MTISIMVIYFVLLFIYFIILHLQSFTSYYQAFTPTKTNLKYYMK